MLAKMSENDVLSDVRLEDITVVFCRFRALRRGHFFIPALIDAIRHCIPAVLDP